MAYLLGVDTGGTYTDAAIVDDVSDSVVGSAKALTMRSDLTLGIGEAIDAALSTAGILVDDIALVSLSTTLATNALVEGQGGRVALFRSGFLNVILKEAALQKPCGRIRFCLSAAAIATRGVKWRRLILMKSGRKP